MSKYLKFIIPIVIIAAIAAAAPFLFRKPPVKPQEFTLTIWNLWDDSDSFQEIIEDYAARNENVKINYYKKVYDGYENLILNAMAEGDGPDIFLINNSWVDKYAKKIVPMPEGAPLLSEIANPLGSYGIINLKNDFVDVAVEDVVLDDGKIYALPLSIDTLALYYNKDLLNNAGIPVPPKTWTDFKEAVIKLRKLDENNKIIRAGAAIGCAYNVNRSADILSLLMLQGGTPMTGENNNSARFSQIVWQDGKSFSPGEAALKFYTDFTNSQYEIYTWNAGMDYSIDAFAEGRAAMAIGYSYLADEIKKKSPHLNFDITTIPQIKEASQNVNYANYWVYSVSRLSKHPSAAWDFLKFATSKIEAAKYLKATGNPAARKDLILAQLEDPDLEVFASQLLTAKSWFQKDPEKVEEIFAEMIDDVNYGRKSVSEAIKYGEGRVSQVLGIK